VRWRCSQCSSLEGVRSLEERAAAVDAKAKMAEEKLNESREIMRAARALERRFSERVTNPVLMEKTGEPLCVLLPASNKMVRFLLYCAQCSFSRIPLSLY